MIYDVLCHCHQVICSLHVLQLTSICCYRFLFNAFIAKDTLLNMNLIDYWLVVVTCCCSGNWGMAPWQRSYNFEDRTLSCVYGKNLNDWHIIICDHISVLQDAAEIWVQSNILTGAPGSSYVVHSQMNILKINEKKETWLFFIMFCNLSYHDVT